MKFNDKTILIKTDATTNTKNNVKLYKQLCRGKIDIWDKGMTEITKAIIFHVMCQLLPFSLYKILKLHNTLFFFCIGIMQGISMNHM